MDLHLRVDFILIVLAFVCLWGWTQSDLTSRLISLLPPWWTTGFNPPPPSVLLAQHTSAHTPCPLHHSWGPLPYSLCENIYSFPGYLFKDTFRSHTPFLPISGPSRFSMRSRSSELDIFTLLAIHSVWILNLETFHADGLCIDLIKIQLYLLEREMSSTPSKIHQLKP